MMTFKAFGLFFACSMAVTVPFRSMAAEAANVRPFLDKYCSDCHDAESKKGNLDLKALPLELENAKNFSAWVTIHDKVASGDMPPKKKAQPDKKELTAFTNTLAKALMTVEQAQTASEGRATQRRLNRFEYENALRDLLHAPWLQVKDSLPEDGEAFRFNKIGEALDVSHVQMARYLNAADYALRQVVATQVERPETRTNRFYAREQGSYTRPMKFSVFNTAPERATFPVLGTHAQPDVRSGKAPITVGKADPKARDEEGVGLVASTYEPIEPKFSQFKAPAAGHYRLHFSAISVWVGPGKGDKWFIPDFDTVSAGRRPEPVTVYSETPPRLLRRLGAFDVTPEPSVKDMDVWLLAGETIRPDPARLFRSRPGAGRFHNPLAEKDGQPGVVFRWLEVEGPIYDEWPTAGHKLLFGDLPLKKAERGNFAVEVVSANPQQDAERLLRTFIQQAYQRSDVDSEVQRFLPVIKGALKSGSSFMNAMLAGYTTVLCSPEFIYLDETPGRLTDHALAERLSFFLWNSEPDQQLQAVAASGKLHQPAVLREQTERMLLNPKVSQFENAFLDYWLDLRKMEAAAPDSGLYPDYYLDDLLTESAQTETQLFFAELVRHNLPARNIVSSDFSMLNERLAQHYGLPSVSGVAFQRVSLPKDSPRGGLMTQASVLKVTANGTTTSPVLRGAWIMERILGKPAPKPPPNVPAVEPDIRGATTIRQQLDKHRDQATCAACHKNIDPAGFALENFDVMGGWRDFYRAQGDGTPLPGIGKNGQKFAFHQGPAVDASGELPDGRKFKDVRELKQLLLNDQRQIARNLVQQLAVYATGAPVRFSDRPQIEAILSHSQPMEYGVRTLVEELVMSDLFLKK